MEALSSPSAKLLYMIAVMHHEQDITQEDSLSLKRRTLLSLLTELVFCHHTEIFQTVADNPDEATLRARLITMRDHFHTTDDASAASAASAEVACKNAISNSMQRWIYSR